MSSEDSTKALQALYAKNSKKKNWTQLQEKLKKHPALQRVLLEVAKRQENVQSEDPKDQTLKANYQNLLRENQQLNNQRESLTKKIADLNAEKIQIMRKTSLLKFFSKQEYLVYLSKIQAINKQHNVDEKIKKCQELNAALREIHAQGSRFLNSELESDQEDGSAGAKKVDAGLVGEYIMTQKKKILAKIEEKEEMFLIHKELSEKLTAQKNEFSEVLKQQEPYLQEKVEDSVRKVMNIKAKEVLIEFLAEYKAELIKARPKSTNTTPTKDKKSSAAARVAASNKSFEDFCREIEKNKKQLAFISGSKVQTNEFMALNYIPLIESIQKITQGIEQSLLISSKNWDSLSSYPPTLYQGEFAEEVYSPGLQELLNLFKDPFKFYFYLPDKIIKLILKLQQLNEKKSVGTEQVALNSAKLNYENKKKILIRECTILNEELSSELQYKSNIEDLIKWFETSPNYPFVNIVKFHLGLTFSELLEKWKAKFNKPASD